MVRLDFDCRPLPPDSSPDGWSGRGTPRLLARQLDPGRYPPSYPADPWLVGQWSAWTLTAGRRPLIRAKTAGPGKALLARRLDPGRGPPSHPADPWLVGRWSAGTLTADRRPLVRAQTAGPGEALLARRLVLGGASSPVTAADPWLVGPWSDCGCRPPPLVLGPGDRPGVGAPRLQDLRR